MAQEHVGNFMRPVAALHWKGLVTHADSFRKVSVAVTVVAMKMVHVIVLKTESINMGLSFHHLTHESISIIQNFLPYTVESTIEVVLLRM